MLAAIPAGFPSRLPWQRFDRTAFNNFLLGQGLLPPELLANAVHEMFVPAQEAKPVAPAKR